MLVSDQGKGLRLETYKGKKKKERKEMTRGPVFQMESRALKLTQLLFSKLRDSRPHALKDIAAARSAR